MDEYPITMDQLYTAQDVQARQRLRRNEEDP